MRVVSFHVDAGVPKTDAAIVMLRCVVNETVCNGPGIMPDHATTEGIDGVSIIGRSDEHDALENYGSNFEIVGVLDMKHPL